MPSQASKRLVCVNVLGTCSVVARAWSWQVARAAVMAWTVTRIYWCDGGPLCWVCGILGEWVCWVDGYCMKLCPGDVMELQFMLSLNRMDTMCVWNAWL